MAGKTCVVTGATSGIGAETARGLAAAGATVILVGRDPACTEAARDTLGAAGAFAAEFFPDGHLHSILIVNIGHPGPNPLLDRLPRLHQDDVVQWI